MNSQALTCKYNDCDLIYERPVTLSCGNTLCQHHLKEMINDQTLKCCLSPDKAIIDQAQQQLFVLQIRQGNL